MIHVYNVFFSSSLFSLFLHTNSIVKNGTRRKQSQTCLGPEQRVDVRRVTRQVCSEGESTYMYIKVNNIIYYYMYINKESAGR